MALFDSVDSIIKDLESKVVRLRAMQGKHEAKAKNISSTIEDLKEERAVEIDEAKRAAAIAHKFENLISGV